MISHVQWTTDIYKESVATRLIAVACHRASQWAMALRKWWSKNRFTCASGGGQREDIGKLIGNQIGNPDEIELSTVQQNLAIFET